MELSKAMSEVESIQVDAEPFLLRTVSHGSEGIRALLYIYIYIKYMT